MQRGHQWELEVFGCCSDEFDRTEYVPWQDAVARVILSQSERDWNPCAPKTLLAEELFNAVKKFLYPENAHRLRLYCGLGTALDFWHGIDAFFSIDDLIVALDLTTMSKSPARIDVIYFLPSDLRAGLDVVAYRIAETFNDHFQRLVDEDRRKKRLATKRRRRAERKASASTQQDHP